MKKIIIILLAVLLGCTTAQIKPSVTDDMFTSYYPKLMVQIHKTVLNKGNKGHIWYWQVNGGQGIAINIDKHRYMSNIDYYYSLEQILSEINCIGLDSAFINDHKWMKYAFVNEEDFLHTGYFTRKDQYFIFVFRISLLGKKYVQELRKFNKTRVMTDELELLLVEAFEYTDALFTIKY